MMRGESGKEERRVEKRRVKRREESSREIRRFEEE